jgi:MFS family permease
VLHEKKLLFLTRFIRLLAYGALSVVLVFYLTGLGLKESETGLLFTMTLLGDTAISLMLTTAADRIGRRRTLIAGSILMAGAGLVFASTNVFWILVLAGTIGVVSPSGHEVGPFLPVEQAALAQIVRDHSRTRTFAWYTLAGSFATAIGSLLGGLIPNLAPGGASAIEGYRAVVILYAGVGLLLGFLFARLSPVVEVGAFGQKNAIRPHQRTWAGISHSRGVVLKLASLFALDSFGGGFVVQSLAVYWFHLRFGVEPAVLGAVFFGANVFAGISALLVSRLANRVGLVKTMVFTHLPSNILLILVPLMPTFPWAVAVLLARFSISQMDVPARQSYVMAVVREQERSAAAGITGVARTIGASISPWLAALMFAKPLLISVPFFAAGTLKITYDLLLYKASVSLRPPEELP